MRTDVRLALFQKYISENTKKRIFSPYAFIFNSLYYLAFGMYGWFTGYFFGTLLLIVAGIALLGSWWVIPSFLILSRVINAFTAEKIKTKYMQKFIAKNQDVNYSKPIVFYQSSVKKLVFASVLSCGLFEFYWMYKNWKNIRQDAKDNEIYPIFQSWVLGIFFVWPLLKIIRLNLERSKTEGSKYVYFAAGYTLCFWLQTAMMIFNLLVPITQTAALILWGLYMAVWLTGIATLAAIQKRVNFHSRKTNRKSELPTGWEKWEIFVVVAGLLLNGVMFVLQSGVQQNDKNLGLALSSTYRMMEGYSSFCRKQGVEMVNFPKVYAEYFAPEIDIINRKLKPYNLTMEQAWEFFRVRMNNVLDESIMGEFRALKPHIIDIIVEEHKQENIQNFDENVAREFLQKEITYPVMCEKTDQNARMIIESNETYKKLFRETVAKIR